MNDKELIKGGIEIKPYFQERFFPVETLMEQIANTTDEDRETFRRSCDEIMEKMHVKNSVERKRQLMRLEKEMLVDMVFDLESRNETLVNNLLEVERMYNDLKGEKEDDT